MNESTMHPDIETRWRAMHKELSAHPKFAGHLSGLFVGHKPSEYSRHKTRVLYIGKATKGPFDIPDASHKWFNLPRGGFWPFARQASRVADATCEDMSNLAWSNLCKIGVKRNNPNDELVAKFEDLAVGSLQHEIASLNPSIIIFATETYLDKLVYRILKTAQGSDGFKDESVKDTPMYYRRSRDGFPPILWIRHPERKTREYKELALSRLSDLLSSSR